MFILTNFHLTFWLCQLNFELFQNYVENTFDTQNKFKKCANKIQLKYFCRWQTLQLSGTERNARHFAHLFAFLFWKQIFWFLNKVCKFFSSFTHVLKNWTLNHFYLYVSLEFLRLSKERKKVNWRKFLLSWMHICV